jgi:tetratricopeptide (TPR) repeat protein
MSALHRAAPRYAAVLLLGGAASACTSLGPPPGPARLPPRTLPPVSSPAPAPEPAPTEPGPATVPLPGEPPPGAALPPAAPSRPRSDAAEASSTLLAESRAASRAGNVSTATALVERALRLDPNNAELWIERGELELRAGNRAQAVIMARKALTLTSDDVSLRRRAERLLDAAGG